MGSGPARYVRSNVCSPRTAQRVPSMHHWEPSHIHVAHQLGHVEGVEAPAGAAPRTFCDDCGATSHAKCRTAP
eukprot:5977758-Prymnesium_polylepis.1